MNTTMRYVISGLKDYERVDAENEQLRIENEQLRDANVQLRIEISRLMNQDTKGVT